LIMAELCSSIKIDAIRRLFGAPLRENMRPTPLLLHRRVV
jgi:hypothetical protein